MKHRRGGPLGGHRVTTIEGIAFQCDRASLPGTWLIRPAEMLDRLAAGLKVRRGSTPLAMHTGIHVRLDDGTEVIVEQRVFPLRKGFVDGLTWSPIEQFSARDRGGWHVTVPVYAIRGIDEQAVSEAINRLNHLEGRSFLVEDCTALVERVFGGRRLYADSPLLRALGVAVRLGDPALPLIRPDVQLPSSIEERLQTQALTRLPPPYARPGSPSLRTRAYQLALAALVGICLGWLVANKRLQ